MLHSYNWENIVSINNSGMRQTNTEYERNATELSYLENVISILSYTNN